MPKQNPLPEAEFVRNTFILREMDLPPNVRLSKRSLLRWFALASGLISEAESRSTILDVLDALLYLQLSRKTKPTTTDIQAYLKLKEKKISEKLLRYHLKRLIDMNIIRRKKLRYSFNPSPNSDPDNFRETYSHHVTKRITNALTNVETGIDRLVDSYQSL